MIQDILYTIELVVLASCSHAIILGCDFLSRHAATIDCAQAEVWFSPLPDPLLDAASPGSYVKALVAEDIDLPPCFSVLVCLSYVHDGTVLFTPSHTSLRWKCLRLSCAILTISAGLSILLVSNPLFLPTALDLSECLRSVQPFASLLIREETDDVPHLALSSQPTSCYT